MENIPTFQTVASNFTQELILGDRLMSLALTWNSRSEVWYMTLEDIDSGHIARGIKVIPNWALVKQYRAYLPNFEGDIMAVAATEKVSERVTYDNLNVEYKLNYLTETEVETWENENGLG